MAQEGTFCIPGHKDVPASCNRVAPVLGRIGNKWSMLVINFLGAGPVRFNELRRKIGGVSQRMLTLTVRGLERDGFIKRTVHPTIPPRVDYELTPLGKSLLEPIQQLGMWTVENLGAIQKAQRRYDKRHGSSER
jgi:DNA-binding HxlR family transcriptional regulator